MSVPGENSFYPAPVGKWAQKTYDECAQERYATGEPGKVQGPCGDCRRALLEPGPWGQYSGKIRFIEKPGVQDEWGRHVAKRRSDPRVAYTEVKVQVRDLVRNVGIVDPFASAGAGGGVGTRGNFVSSSPTR